MTDLSQSYTRRQLWTVRMASGELRTFLAKSATEAMRIALGFQQWNCGSDITPGDQEVIHVERLAGDVWEAQDAA